MGFFKNKLLNDFLVYGLGTITSKSIAFLSIPIYTRIFLPEIYGQLEFYLIIGSFFAAFLNLGLDASLSFFFKVGNHFNDRKKATITNIFLITTFWGLLLFCFSNIFSDYLKTDFFKPKIFKYIIIIFFLETLINILLNVLRLEMKSKMFTFYQIFNGILSNSLSILFVLFWEPTIEKLFMGRLIASSIVFFPLLISNYSYFSLNEVNLKNIKTIILFGIPLLPSSFFDVIFNYTDRLIISHFLDYYQLGIFSAGARISIIIGLFTSSFTLAILPHLLEAIDQENKNLISSFQKNFFWISDLIIILFYGFSEIICYLLLGNEYQDSFIILGFYIIHPIYRASYNLVSVGIWKSKKTYLSTITSLISCVINLILSILLINIIGLNGVSIATGISSLFWIFITAIFSERIYSTGININSFLFDKIVLIICLGVMTFLFNVIDSNLINYLGILLIILLYGIFVWISKSEVIIEFRNKLFHEKI